jgi:hypothetical protein
MPQLAEFSEGLIGNTDFLTYIKGAIVNYNHNERELMVSNPSKDYTYVMDRNGNWSRRAFTAQEYVNNYPTSYRIDKEGKFYKVDADDNDTNQVYLLSNVIKLGTIAFKQAYRFVVRGYFENNEKSLLGSCVLDPTKFYDDAKKVLVLDYKNLDLFNKLEVGRTVYIKPSNSSGYETTAKVIRKEASPNRVQFSESIFKGSSGMYDFYELGVLGLYVFGSYDGRQWSLIGGNEKSGKFTDIGCKIAHTDIKFIRICMAGKISHASRIDFVEISYDGSSLNTKLR